MRKYKQLLLLIVTLLSIGLLILYRQEYKRLHYVLEVLNFFGDPPPCNYSELVFEKNQIPQNDWGHTPYWRFVGDVQVYSAFWNKEKKEAKAIAVGSNDIDQKVSCYLWIDGEIKPRKGNFKNAKVDFDKERKYVLYFFYCSVKNIDTEQPYAVSYTLKSKRLSNLDKIQLFTNPRSMSNDTIACVVPSEYSKQNLVEFLSYYKLLGVDRFLFYYSSIPFKLSTIIQNLSPKLEFRMTTFLWNNFDFSDDITRRIVTEDCLARTSGTMKNILILKSNEFIVPKRFSSLPFLFDSIDPERKAHSFSLQVLKFCIVQVQQNEPIILQNTLYEPDGSLENLQVFRKESEDDVIITQAITKETVAIHKYVECNDRLAKTIKENSILRFGTELKKSTLIRLLNYKKL